MVPKVFRNDINSTISAVIAVPKDQIYTGSIKSFNPNKGYRVAGSREKTYEKGGSCN